MIDKTIICTVLGLYRISTIYTILNMVEIILLCCSLSGIRVLLNYSGLVGKISKNFKKKNKK